MRRGLLTGGAVVAGLILQACATKPVAYGPVGPETPYGYMDRQNADGGFTVSVKMPGHAAPGELRAFFDRRAGELCPAGIERTNVFRLHRSEFTTSGYVYGGAGVSSRVAVGTDLEGYVYCKPGAAPAPAAAAAAAE